MPVVTNTVKYPNQTIAAGRVTIDLVGDNGRPLTDGAFVTAGDYAIAASYGADLVAGVWSVNLVANSLINPAGTAYRVQESVDGRVSTYYIDVPDGAGPYVAEDRLVDPPAAIASSALSSHLTDTADAHDASAVSFVPTDSVVATDVQAAIEAAADVQFPNVLVFTGAAAENVYHGYFWTPGVPLGPFRWEAWLRFDGSQTGYWISEGHGGAHAILAGFSGFAPSGNVYTGSGTTSFTGDYLAQVGEWLHYCLAWDGTYLMQFVNGILCSYISLTARQSQFGNVLIGGSDHNNFIGAIAQIRAWEGICPGGMSAGFMPERHFNDNLTGFTPSSGPIQFCTSYLTGDNSFPDTSGGFAGRLHPGKLSYTGGIGQSGVNSFASRERDATAPFGNNHAVARVRTAPTPATPPVGARFYDSFGRADQLLAFTYDPAPSLGSTEVGGAAWIYTARDWGLFDGALVTYNPNPAVAEFDTGSGDGDFRWTRRATPTNGIQACNTSFRGNGTNNWSVLCSDGGTIALYRPAGSNAATYNPGVTTWTKLRVVCSGTTITTYTDDGGSGWIQQGQLTGETANQTDGRIGVLSRFAGQTQRILDIAAI